MFLCARTYSKKADKTIEHWQELLRKIQVDQEHISDLAERSLLHERVEPLPYDLDPLQDSTIDPTKVEEQPTVASADEEDESSEEEYDDEADESQEDEL